MTAPLPIVKLAVEVDLTEVLDACDDSRSFDLLAGAVEHLDNIEAEQKLTEWLIERADGTNESDRAMLVRIKEQIEKQLALPLWTGPKPKQPNTKET